MTSYFISSDVEVSGDGLSEAAPFKFISEAPNGSHTFHIKRGVKTLASASFPASLTTTANVKTFTSSGITFTGYGDEGSCILSGEVPWPSEPEPVTVNGLACKSFNRGEESSPFWYPVAGSAISYPSICAPTADDDIDQFINNPSAFDDIVAGSVGYKFVDAANYGGNTDASKEVSYSLFSSGPSVYHIQIRAPGFWARADAVSPLIGCQIVLRNGTNFTSYVGVVVSYDAVEGFVKVSSSSIPNTGADGNGFFFALFGHQYGLRKPQQYAMLEGNVGWVASLPTADAYSVACYSGLVIFFGGDGLTFDVNESWESCGVSVGLPNASRAGYFLYAGQGASNITCGHITAHGMRNFDHLGGVVQLAGSGTVTGVRLNGIDRYDCIGMRAIDVASSGGVTDFEDAGPSTLTGNGGGMRIAGSGSGATIQDFTVAPGAAIHDNPLNNTYQEYRDTSVRDFVICGQVNGFVNQYTGSSYSATQRRASNGIVLGGYVKLDQSDREMLNQWRNDNGNWNGEHDRMIMVHGKNGCAVGRGSGVSDFPNTGHVSRRSVYEKFGCIQTDAVEGMLFENCVFLGKASVVTGDILTYLSDNGATVVDCVSSDELYTGTITEAMHQKLTLNANGDGYEAYTFGATQLGLTLTAYGSPRTINKPALIHDYLFVGRQSGKMIGSFVNQNALAVMSLPEGMGDNDKVHPSLFGGTDLIPLEDCPDQDSLTIILRVTDEGAVNGPHQDFEFELPIHKYAAGAPEPVKYASGIGLKLKWGPSLTV